MYIIIVGAGEVGSYLARILIEEGHDVAIVESNAELARSLDSSLDALVVHGTGVSRQSLDSAGLVKADLVLAVTEIDEVNLVACMTAARFGNAPQTVARVRRTEYLAGESSLSADEMGLSLLVGPERSAAGEVMSLLLYDGPGEIHYLANGLIALLELPLDAESPFTSDSLAVLREDATMPEPSLVAAVSGPRGFRIPRGEDTLSPDERAYILTTPGNIKEFWILSGKPWRHVSHALIIGCGTIGFNLAGQLEARRMYPTIIEIDRARAEWLSQRLSRSIVLHGDGTDPALLKEQLDERADAVVVLLEDDEKSVLVGLLAKHMGARKVIVRSDKPAYNHIAHKLGVDAVISPKDAVAAEILRFVRRDVVADAYMLGDHEGEIVELTVPDRADHPLVGVPLHALELPPSSLMGAVLRDGEVTICTGDTVLRPGDEVLVIGLASALPEVHKLFR